MKLGISSYALTWSIGVPGYEKPQKPLTAEGLLEKADELGVRVVQFADNLPVHQMSIEQQSHLKSLSARLRMELEVGTRGTNPGHLKQCLFIADIMDSRIVRTLVTTPDLQQAVAEIREVLPQFAAAGITLALENHGLHSTSELIELFDILDSPYVRCCLDTVNSFGALESPDHVIRELAPYTINLHMKDFTIARVDHQMGFVILGTPAGDGKLDLNRLEFELNRHHRNPNCILELWTPFTETVENTIRIENQWCRQSIDFLKHRFSK